MSHDDRRQWREEAACTQTDPEAFFPEPGASAAPALRICTTCTVRAECLHDALKRRDVTFGVRGGLTPTQRRALLRQGAGRAA
jgi:WhiB family redox-sensing transcriptional regulator